MRASVDLGAGCDGTTSTTHALPIFLYINVFSGSTSSS
jgi:hypothetical protein